MGKLVIGREQAAVAQENDADGAQGRRRGDKKHNHDLIAHSLKWRDAGEKLSCHHSGQIDNPDDLNFQLCVNGEVRQNSNTRHLIFSCRKLIAYASKFYTLYPGDIIMTGTPQGVGPLEVGDLLECCFDVIGRMEVEVQ